MARLNSLNRLVLLQMLDAIALDEVAKSLPPVWRAVYKSASDQGIIDQLVEIQSNLLDFVDALPQLITATYKPMNFSVFSNDFTVPALGASNPATVTSTAWMNVGDILSVGPSTGPVLAWQLLQVQAKSATGATSLDLFNLGCPGVTIGSVIPAGSFIKFVVPS